MKRVLGFSAAVGLAFLFARILSRPGGAEAEADLAMRRRRAAQASSTALPDAGRSWAPAVEKGNVRTLKVSDVPAPGRTRTPEEEEEAAAVDAAGRTPSAAVFGGIHGSDTSVSVYARVGNLPTGGRGEESGAPGAGPDAAGRGVKGPGPSAGGGKSGKTPAKVPGPGDDESSWLARTGGLINAAKGLGSRPSDPNQRALLKLSQDPVGQQFLQDQKVGSAARAALARVRSGGTVSPGQEMEAVAGAMAANGMATDPESVAMQLSRADVPQGPPITPLQASEILDSMRAALPPPEVLEQRARDADKPRPIHAPPPGSAIKAYDAVRDVLKQAKEKWGMAPEFPLTVFGVESNYGKNTGKHLVNEVLHGEMRTRSADSARYKLAKADLAALITLQARGDLGPYTATTLRGSNGAAFGHTQFRAETWMRSARNPDSDGGIRDPFDVRTAVYSTAHHLAVSRHNQGMDHALWHYNQSTEYRDKVNAGARVNRQLTDRVIP